ENPACSLLSGPLFLGSQDDTQMIDIRNVTKIFKTKSADIQAVDDVSMDFCHGEISVVIGYSGAGKSTLIRLFNGLEMPSSGDVVIGEDIISSMSKPALRKKRQKVSMIFQHFNLLWSRTVAENISFPLEIAGVPKRERREKVQRLAERVGRGGGADQYPSELSGRASRAVGAPRALCKEAGGLLCGEAPRVLDRGRAAGVRALLLKVREGGDLTRAVLDDEVCLLRSLAAAPGVVAGGELVGARAVMKLCQT